VAGERGAVDVAVKASEVALMAGALLARSRRRVFGESSNDFKYKKLNNVV